MSTIGRAIAVAATAHEGQTGKDGAPFILHPLRVMLGVGSDAERQVAALHDVVENTSVTLADLRSAGFSEEVLQAVDALTRREGEEYFDFVRRAIADPLARPVKRADLLDNLATALQASPRSKAASKIEKYRAALAIVETAGLAGERAPDDSAHLAVPFPPGRPGTPAEWLHAPAPLGAGALALEHLRSARRAYRGLGDELPSERLHDLRVALRRLRSVLRTFDDVRRAAGRKSYRRLRRLMRATSRVRDLDVRLRWLASVPAERGDHPALGRLRTRLEAERAEAAAKASRVLAETFPRLDRRLRRRLARWPADLELLESLAAPPLAAALSAAATSLRGELADALGRAASREETDLHAARILGKRLRYALEPFGEAAAAQVDVLTSLQDLLGDLLDLAGLLLEIEQELESAAQVPDDGYASALRATRRHLRAARARAQAALERGYQGGNADARLAGAIGVFATASSRASD